MITTADLREGENSSDAGSIRLRFSTIYRRANWLQPISRIALKALESIEFVRVRIILISI